MEKKQREAQMVSEWRKERHAREDQEVNRMLKNIEESNNLRLIKVFFSIQFFLTILSVVRKITILAQPR